MNNSSWDMVALVDQIQNKWQQLLITARRRHYALPVWSMVDQFASVDALISRYNKRKFLHSTMEQSHVVQLACWLIEQAAELEGSDASSNVERFIERLDTRLLSQADAISAQEAQQVRFQQHPDSGAMMAWRTNG